MIVTHYQRLLDYIEPDFVHVLAGGRIIESGDKNLALKLEEQGYAYKVLVERQARDIGFYIYELRAFGEG